MSEAVDVQNKDTSAPPVQTTEEKKVRQAKSDSDLESQIKERLEKQGYTITVDANILGKSGIEQVFDMLAHRDDGFTRYSIAICITTGGDRETEVNTIFDFANKAYDTGIYNRIIIASPELSEEAKQLAEKQRIQVIDSLENLPDLEPVKEAKPSEPFKFETKSQLVQSLETRGYRVEEKATVQGKSQVEYVFDILAYRDIDQVSYSMGIDFLSAEKEVGLTQVAVFDTKAYDVGINKKAIIVSPGLSPEAKQFAQHQRIKVLELDHKSASQFRHNLYN